MRAILIAVLSVAALTAAPLAGTAAASAPANGFPPPMWHGETDEGYGATLAAAELNAKQNIQSDFGLCRVPFNFYAYGQFTDGSWWADVSADCDLRN
jgi:hypothetical protein